MELVLDCDSEVPSWRIAIGACWLETHVGGGTLEAGQHRPGIVLSRKPLNIDNIKDILAVDVACLQIFLLIEEILRLM